MEKVDARVQLVMRPSELKALDEWCERNGFWSRSEAIRHMVAKGVKRDLPKP